MCFKVAVFAVLIFAGCSGRTTNEASQLASIEAKTSSEILATQSEAENTRRAQQNAGLRAALENAKGEDLPARVPELAQGNTLMEKSDHIEVRVWGVLPCGS